MKVERKATVVRYLALIPLLAGLIASYPDDNTYFWVGLAGSVAVSALEFPLLKATVHFRAVLTQNGTQVFDTDIQVVEKTSYWGFTEWDWESVSIRASTVLDQAVTKSIADLFMEIETELDRQMN
ncbi:MAG: hypothetical protein JSW50_07475 [Candidatus Latescibacterota bacterium]|nr:MAG: hypothetical protein JSW50_07475 [Candidatus Latescibacterota bacterium]